MRNANRVDYSNMYNNNICYTIYSLTRGVADTKATRQQFHDVYNFDYLFVDLLPAGYYAAIISLLYERADNR